ncbi:MAG: fibrillarin-like rRNA/tRNA 2'-O-methyltransferase [Nanoarchaeota archaeon]|nr:fibrillarin-like rRNA/tRNA 2'-O-methyltransferase [Nanoarchaeota archaeon]
MKKSRIFEVYEDYKKKIYTVNLTPGKKVYDERLVKEKGAEYREWNPNRSKLAASIIKGTQNIFMRKGSVILYLGCASGTTVSHVSDIVGKEGFVFALDFAPITMREMVFVSEDRKNIAPILADANKPQTYIDKVSQVDVIFQDIAQRNQLDIFLKNIDIFLKKEGYALLAVKTRSIDITRKPKAIFAEIKQKLERELAIIDYKLLDPFEKDHCMFICKNK